MKQTYSHTTQNSRATIRRHNRYYPKGMFLVRLQAGADPVAYINRCTEEDAANRQRKVMAYLAERAARSAPVIEPDNQLPLF